MRTKTLKLAAYAAAALCATGVWAETDIKEDACFNMGTSGGNYNFKPSDNTLTVTFDGTWNNTSGWLAFGNASNSTETFGTTVFDVSFDPKEGATTGTWYVGAGSGNGTLKIESGTYSATSWEVGQGGKTGVVEVEGGDVRTTGDMILGAGASGSGTVKVSGGYVHVGGQLMVARYESSEGSVEISDATMEVESWVCIGRGEGSRDNRKGKLTVNDGGVLLHKTSNNNNHLVIGNYAGENCENELIVNEGGFVQSYSDIWVGENGTATLTINGGTVRAATESGGQRWIYMNSGNNPDSETAINLNGGVLEVGRITKGTGATATVTFNGGTLKAIASDTLIAASETLTVTVGEKGGTIDTNGKNVTIAQAITGEGTLEIVGGGKVTFTANPTCAIKWADDTTVQFAEGQVGCIEIDEGVFTVPSTLELTAVKLGKNAFLKYDLSSVTDTEAEDQTLAADVAIDLPAGETVNEHILIKNDGTIKWEAYLDGTALKAKNMMGETITTTIWTDFGGGHWCDTLQNWTCGKPSAGVKTIIPFGTRITQGTANLDCGDMVLKTTGQLQIDSDSNNLSLYHFAAGTISGDGTLYMSLNYFETTGSYDSYINLPLTLFANSRNTYIQGKSGHTIYINAPLTVDTQAKGCTVQNNVVINSDVTITAGSTLTFRNTQTLKGAIAGSGTIAGSFTTAEGATLKSEISADGTVAGVLTVTGAADLSNATLDITGGEYVASAADGTTLVLLKAVGEIILPGVTSYTLGGNEWTLSVGSVTEDEVTYNTLALVKGEDEPAGDDPIPATVADDAAVTTVVGGFEDDTLADIVKTVEDYNAFYAWVSVNNIDHTAAAGSAYLRASYVLGASALLQNQPELSINEFAEDAVAGAWSFTLTITDGENAVNAAVASLAKLVKAGSDLKNLAAPAAENIEVTGENGTYTVTIVPTDDTQYFMQIRE